MGVIDICVSELLAESSNVASFGMLMVTTLSSEETLAFCCSTPWLVTIQFPDRLPWSHILICSSVVSPGVRVGIGVGIGVGVAVLVGVAVDVTVLVGVGVGVTVPVGVGVGVAVGAGVPLGKTTTEYVALMLRFWLMFTVVCTDEGLVTPSAGYQPVKAYPD